MAIPNVSEGRDRARVERLRDGFAGVTVLDTHSDPDHNRSVFTAAAPQGALADALVALAGAAVREIDLNAHTGLHPCVGALDVMPVVHLDDASARRRVCRGHRGGRARGRGARPAGVPLRPAGHPARAPRASRPAPGGWRALAARMESGELAPDFGPPRAHPTAGAVLATARPPLVAFNVDLDTDDVELARIGGRPDPRVGAGRAGGVRAIGLQLADRGRAQVSTNVHDHRATSLAGVVEAVRSRAPVAEAELVGLAPRAAFDGFPADVPLRDFDPERHLIENALRSPD